ncbi:MAG: hypothetical protein AB7G75_10350 [Candidatus Binatia bacterium]
MWLYKALVAIVGIGMLSVMLGACEQEGPAERAGQHVDEAMKEAGEAMEKAGDQAQEAVEEAGEALDKAGDKAQGTAN